jgi:predicted Ser/Thr protein kinase
MIGKYVGDYQITAQLGEGGMGMVYKGVHPTLGQVVAIKMLHPNLVNAPGIKDRFVREAQAMARLRHQNILQLYNFIESAEGCFIVMEYVEGVDFEDVLEKQGLLAPDKAIDYFLPVLKAMQFAHQNGIIHRDIKPSNIMLLNDGIVKVMDFGTAKMSSGPQLTAAGMTLGTVVYMSPEQLMGRDLSPQADIYSLGVTLYELVTGRLPFYHENEMTLMKMIMKEQPPPPTQHYPALPQQLEAVILRSMAKERQQRYASCEEFSNELLRVKNAVYGASSGAMPPSGPQAAPSSPAVAPPVEDTQTMSHPGQATTLQAAAKPDSGLGTLGIVGIVLAGVGALLIPVLGLTAGWPAGGGAGGGLLLVGLILLIIGLTQGRGGSSGGGATSPSTAAAAPPPAATTAPAGAKCLEIIDGPNRGMRIDLLDQPITVGRAPGNTITISDPSVSSHHARIDPYNGKFYLSDLQSSNGTYVNNARVEQQELKKGDLIALGASRIVVHV